MGGKIIPIERNRSFQQQIDEAEKISGVADPVKRLLQDPANRNLSIDDMKKRDIDNFHLLYGSKGMKTYRFDKLQHSIVFRGKVFSNCMAKLGCRAFVDNKKDPNKMTPKERQDMSLRIDLEMADNDVRVEVRESKQYPRDEDALKRGMYLYHGNEIAYFISVPIGARRRSPLILNEGLHWLIRTNGPGDEIILKRPAPVPRGEIKPSVH